jgi:hypothetical protein
MQKTSTLVFLASVVALAPAGCGSSKRVENSFDPPSLMRLNAIQDDASVVVACRIPTLPEKLPGTDLTELTRAESSVLIEVPKSRLDALAELTGLERASVWGDNRTVAKMDIRLKSELLTAWDRGDARPLMVLARFAEGTTGIEEKLALQGAPPTTVAGTVATLMVDPDALLRVLAVEELVSVAASHTLVPLPGN